MRDAINACRYLFLRECWEPEENILRVVVEEVKADGPPEDFEVLPDKVIGGTVAIESDPSCQMFELVWPSYVAYGVRKESFASRDDSEVFEGRLFRVYSKSNYRDYVGRGTFASDEYPGPLKHWCLVCLTHLVDVVGCAEPELRRLRPI
ncbi:MAG: hypothetical protein HZA46_20780 [Planctomycetales bacterium]|nr:hypothetical protein [Planctomycetales bacterium]